MQAVGLFSRRAILGRSNKNVVDLEKIARANSLYKTAAVNFMPSMGSGTELACRRVATSSWKTFCCTSMYLTIL